MGDLKVPELNNCQFAGRITRDPKYGKLANGTGKLEFGIAIDRRYKSGEEWKKETTFLQFIAWGKHADFMSEKLHKGCAVLIDRARAFQDKWTDANGQVVEKTRFVAENIQLMEWPAKDGEVPRQPVATPARHDEAPDIPSYGPPSDDDVF